MKVHKIYSPSPIVTLQLGVPPKYRQECIEKCYKLGDKQNQQTNVKAIMSSYFVRDETDKFNPIFDSIQELIKKLWIKDERLITNMGNVWSAIYQKGHYTQPHNHVPFHLSWVYYLKADGNTPLIFNECNFKVEPEDDMLVIFGAHLIHSVEKHMGEEDRVCLVGNVASEMGSD